jgi:hypothetical protein
MDKQRQVTGCQLLVEDRENFFFLESFTLTPTKKLLYY